MESIMHCNKSASTVLAQKECSHIRELTLTLQTTTSTSLMAMSNVQGSSTLRLDYLSAPLPPNLVIFLTVKLAQVTV